MRALVVDALLPDFAGAAVRSIADPVAGPGEALVRIRAAALNFPDLLMTHGGYQFRPELPFVSGMEYAGEVVAVGEGVDPALLGGAVIGGGKTGAFAELVVARADQLVAKPARLDWAQAAAYRAAYLTAYVAFVRRANLQPGEWVLVHGSAGGVGLACVDLAKAMGARVIAAGSSPERLAVVDQLYAPDAVIDVRGRFREQVKEITGGRGADVIVDPVGGDVFDESTRCIAFDGRLLVVGFTSGRIPTLDVNMPLIKGYAVVGVRAGEYGRRFPERGAENLAAVDTMVADGRLHPHVHAVLPLDQWRTAFDMLVNRQAVGKVVLEP
jgi:NADPH2:quinone reductase